MTALLVRSDYISFYFDCNNNHYFILSDDSAVVQLKNKDLQSGGQELLDSIFGEDSDTEPEKRSPKESATLIAQIAIPSNFQILIAKTSQENGTILQQEVILTDLMKITRRQKQTFSLQLKPFYGILNTICPTGRFLSFVSRLHIRSTMSCMRKTIL
jgi:hypothetical protein